jgi:hypothetical protein
MWWAVGAGIVAITVLVYVYLVSMIMEAVIGFLTRWID